MQITKHKITGEMRRECFIAKNQELLDKHMDDRLEGLPDERLVRRVKIGRNSICPCGSGRKFKKCCISQLRSR